MEKGSSFVGQSVPIPLRERRELPWRDARGIYTTAFHLYLWNFRSEVLWALDSNESGLLEEKQSKVFLRYLLSTRRLK